MTVDRLDPPGLLKIPEMANVSIATGTCIVHISRQTAVDAEGKVVGTTHLEQSRLAVENLKTALEAAGATRRPSEVHHPRRGLQPGRAPARGRPIWRA